MEVTQVLLARVLQMVKPIGGGVYLPEIARRLSAKYEFVAAPKDEELISPDPSKGAEFKHGRMSIGDRSIIIQQLTVFNDGVVVDTTTSTDDSDQFLTDLARWAKEMIPDAESVGPRYYVSNLEVRMEAEIERYAPSIRSIENRIGILLNGYKIEAPRFEVAGVKLHFDQIGKLGPQPIEFNLERRANVPYEKNVWFAQAPLKTADHMNLLLDLEKQT